MSKAGKNKGKYENWLNIEHNDGTKCSIDWENDIKDWKPLNINEFSKEHNNIREQKSDYDDTIDLIESVLFTESDLNIDLVTEAKCAELENWKKNNVFLEVPYKGQKCISVRWVFTEKFIDGKKTVKARLVARGFEEAELRYTDSPTCSKESLRLALTLFTSKGWKCNAIDVKAAFLQGKPLDREIYIDPPVEFRKENIVWKLKTCVYGLNDASRTWYLRVREELMLLGVKPSSYEPSLFYWHHENNLQGLITIHVDDLCWGGTKLFENNVIEKFKNIFEIGKEMTRSFRYLGLAIEQSTDCITVDQNSYSKSIKPIEISKERSNQKTYPLGKEEIGKLRILIGQLNWLATQTRPDLLFDCCQLASNLKEATVEDLCRANKVLKKAKENVTVKLPKLDNLNNLKLVAYHDASYANLKDGGSQGGYVIFITDHAGTKLSPIAWQSKRMKRVVKSTLAAETLSMVEASEASFWILKILQEILGYHDILRIEWRTDSQSLYNAVYSMTSLTDKRLRIDIAILREMLQNKEIQNITWVSSDQQIADSLTKAGCSSTKLFHLLSNYHL